MNEPTIPKSRKKSAFGVPRARGGARKLKARRVSVADSPEARSRLMLAAMIAFRDGNFSVRLPTNWDGIEQRMAEAFNQAIALEERIAREIARLSVSVGQAGRLQQRLAVP